MAIQVDWAGTASTPGGFAGEIYIPKADLTVVSVSPEIYSLDLNDLHLWLRDAEDNEDGRQWPLTHSHNTEAVIAGVTYARQVQILSPYSITFEDGQYRVRLLGGNNNVEDVQNVNQVSVSTANSAGLIVVDTGTGGTSFEDGAVWVDVNGVAGTTGTIGTATNPVNNHDDALTICAANNLSRIRITGNLGPVVAPTSPVTGIAFIGNGRKQSAFNMEAQTFTRCSFTDLVVIGNGTIIASSVDFIRCDLSTVTLASLPAGGFTDCAINSALTIASGGSVVFADCSSNRPRTTNFPSKLVLTGVSTTLIEVSGWSGALVVEGVARTETEIGIHCAGAEIELAASCTAGTITVAGAATLYDNSAGATVIDLTLKNGFADGAVWFDPAGTAGTTGTIGTATNPCSNAADTITIANANGLKRVMIGGYLANFSCSGLGTLQGFSFIGSGNYAFLDLGSASFGACSFERLSVLGSGSISIVVRMYQCLLLSTTLTGAVAAFFTDCVVRALSLPGGATANFANCSGDRPADDTAAVNRLTFQVGAGASKVVFAGWSGAMKIAGVSDAAALVDFDCSGAQITAEATCTAGTITVAGTAVLTDNSAGATVVDLTLKNGFEEGAVWVDINGEAGTAFPRGTAIRPVDNIDDALAICAANNLSRVRMTGAVALLTEPSAPVVAITFLGAGGLCTAFQMGSQTYTDCSFHDMKLFGTPTVAGQFAATGCIIGSVDFAGSLDFGQFNDCSISSSVTFPTGGVIHMRGCAGERPHQNVTQPRITLVGTGSTYLEIADYSGSLVLEGVAHVNADIGIHGNAAQIELAASCTLGKITVAGTAVLTDNSAGSTVIDLTTNSAGVAASLAFMEAMEGGKQEIVADGGGTLICYAADNVTEVARFAIFDDLGARTFDVTQVASRERL